MPQLKQLSCTVQWAETGAPFQEYGTIYGDGIVETFIVIPNKPQPFTIHLKSLNYIYNGLAMVVFIDGNYQANRNRVNLRPMKKHRPLNKTQIDFLLRQREKPVGDGVYMGREWRFDNHNIVEDLPAGVNESHFDQLGTIEVLILRCRAQIPEEFDESGSSSAADSDALGQKGERSLVDEEDDRSRTRPDKDGAAEGNAPVTRRKPKVADGTVEIEHPHGLDGDAGGYPGYNDWQSWYSQNPIHDRRRSLHQSSDQSHFSAPYHFQPPPQNAQGPAAAPPEKHVHFDFGPQPQSKTNHSYAQATQRPQSFHGMSNPFEASHHPPTAQQHGSVSSGRASRHTYSHSAHRPPSPQPDKYRNNMDHQPYSYQPHPHQWPQGHTSMPQPPPHSGPTSFVPPPQSVPPLPVPQHVPHHAQVVNINGFPYYQHLWPAQPPHLVYHPRQHHQGPAWVPQPGSFVPMQQARPGFATTANSSNGSSNNGVDTLRPESGVQNQISTLATETSNDFSKWDDNAGGGVTTNGDTANGWKSPDKADSSTHNASDSQKSDPVINDWDKPDKHDNNQSGTWDLGGENNQTSSNAFNHENAQTASEVARALFGPHGQYFTYKPRGPDDPEPDAEEEPRYDVPKKIAAEKLSTKQVLPGSGFMYWKRRRAPQYIDSLEDPYARFVFKYRTKEQLENDIGIDVEVEPTGDQEMQELQNMNKQELVEMLMRAQSALGGKVPSPPPKSKIPSNDSKAPVPVDPPECHYLNYKLPELRRVVSHATDIGMTTNKTTNGDTAGGGGGAGEQGWATPNNNDSTNFNSNTSFDTGVIGDWDDKAAPSKDNVNWGRPCDGAAEHSHDNTNDSSNTQQQQPDSLASQRFQTQPGSANSSSSILSNTRPFDVSAFSSSPFQQLPHHVQPLRSGYENGSSFVGDYGTVHAPEAPGTMPGTYPQSGAQDRGPW